MAESVWILFVFGNGWRTGESRQTLEPRESSGTVIKEGA